MSFIWSIFKYSGLLRVFDRRRATRHLINLPADYSMDDDAVYLFFSTVDISETGAFISTLNPLPKGMLIDVDFTLLTNDEPVQKGRKISVVAEIMQTITDDKRHFRKGRGMGVRFLNLSTREWCMIESAITGDNAKKTMEIKITTEDVPTKEQEERQIWEIRKQQANLRKEVNSYTHDLESEDFISRKEDEAFLDEEEQKEIEARIAEGIPDESAPDAENANEEPAN